MHHLLFLFNTYASRPCILLASSSQVEHKGFLLWDPALHCGISVGFVVRATLFSAILGWLAPNLHFNLLLSSPDPPERCTVLKIILKSTFLLNFLKSVYVKNHLDTLVHQTANSELGKQARQRRSCVAKDWASSLII